MDLDLTKKNAIVCGSTQGIGRAAASEIAQLGASLILLARDEQALRETVAALPRGSGQTHDFLVADFADPDALERRLADKLVGRPPVHILVNNTGGPPGGPLTGASSEDFLRPLKAHLFCNQVLVRAVMQGMKDARYGRIVNVISTSVKQPIRGLGVSNTVRGAVASWSKTLADELGPFGITVNNVLPGATDTARLAGIMQTKAEKSGKTVDQIRRDMAGEIPAGRIAKPEEIAAAIAFLVSPAASYINGINLPVDGGRTGCL